MPGHLMTTVPSAAPTRLEPAEAADIRHAIEQVLADGPWVLGTPVERFEREFAVYTGIPHVVGVGNGTDALVLAFAALGLEPGSAVLVADNEGGYAATAARQLGLVPRVMDVDRTTMGPVVSDAEAADTPEVACLVVTHLHGDAVPIAELDRWRRARGIAMVEDCAQAHGLLVEGNHVGGTGDAATFSFYPTKNLGAVGDAGAVAFQRDDHAERARSLRQYGWGQRYRVDLPGGRNTRLDSLQAAVLSARLPHLDRRNARRRGVVERYRTAVKGSSVHLHGDPASTVAHHAVVVTEDRNVLDAELERRGVTAALHYPFLVQEMPGLGVAPAPTPQAAWLVQRSLSLPCFPEMTDAEVDQVCGALAEWVDQHG
jgi:aminotransferase EvaB